MKLVTLLTLLSFTLTPTIQGFCIYNNLEESLEGTNSLYIYRPKNGAGSFKKTIRSGGRECCHFTNTDCNETGERNASLEFYAQFGFNGTRINKERELPITCDGGGAIAFEGTSMDDVFAVCSHVNGTHKSYPLPPPLSALNVSSIDF